MDKGSRRRCTDCWCGFIFGLSCMLLVLLLYYAFDNGDPAKFTGLPDWQGNFCGVSTAVLDKPYLYFCQDADGSLNYTTPICLATCPNPLPTNPTQTQCPRGIGVDYPTREFAGMLCLPQNPNMLRDVARATWKHPTVEWLMEVGEIPKAWQPLAVSAIASMMLGLIYLTILDKAAYCLLWTGIALLVVVPGSLGGYLLYCAHNNGADGLPSTGDSKNDLYFGSAFFVISLIFFCVAFFKAGSVDKAIMSIKSSAECVREMPTLLFQPLFSLSFKVPIIVFLMVGFCYLVSVVHEIPVQEYAGGYVDIEFDHKEYVFITFYIFMAGWIMEIVAAISQFVVSYAAQGWFFEHFSHSDGHVRRSLQLFGTIEGFCVAVRYHVGTLAYGAFIIAIVRVPRLVMRFLTKPCRTTNDCCRILSCCVDCYDRWMRYLNKNAWMAVAIKGDNFCTATGTAFQVLHNEVVSIIVLSGATWLFQLTGVGGISALGTYITHMMVTQMDVYSNSASPYYVEDPLFLDLVAFAICFNIVVPFMIVFGQVSDTMLFCFAVQQIQYDKGEGLLQVQPGGRPDSHTFAMLNHVRSS